MPQFYFDLYEDGVVTPEEVSRDLGDVQDARDKAITMLSDIIGQVGDDQERQAVAAIVRNAHHDVVYGATMTFRGYWRSNDEPEGERWERSDHDPLSPSYNPLSRVMRENIEQTALLLSMSRLITDRSLTKTTEVSAVIVAIKQINAVSQQKTRANTL